ncbi:MAG: fibrobacter succinogenes major paralogous domain-containing protein [Mariniphaga sp.]
MHIFPLLFTIGLTGIFISCQQEEDVAPITLSAEITHVSEFGEHDGAISLSVIGGKAPFLYSWSNGDTTRNLTNIPAGIYRIEISDHALQNVSDTFEVLQPQPVELIVVFSVTHPSETGRKDGLIETEVGGGYPPFSYEWSTGADTEIIDGLAAGFYSLTVTDSRGQMLTDSIEVIDKVVDFDGNAYSIIKIGHQIWMKENLRVTRSPDGSAIVSYVYNDNPDFEVTYGRLYTWDVSMNGSTEEGAQGICPCGWHIPSDEEFKILEMHLGMTRAQADMANTWRGAPAGTLLKAGGGSGYEARLAGRRTSGGAYSLMGRMEYMWTSTEYLHGVAAWMTIHPRSGAGIHSRKITGSR